MEIFRENGKRAKFTQKHFKNPYITSDYKARVGEDGVINSADREAFASFGEEKWRTKFLLK